MQITKIPPRSSIGPAALVLLTMVPISLGVIISNNFTRPPDRQTGRKLIGKIISTYENTRATLCALKCTKTAHCTAFNVRAGSLCELLEIDPQQKQTLEDEDGAEYFTKVEIAEIVEPKTTTPAPLQDCRDLPTGTSGVFTVPVGGTPMHVRCDAPWTLFQWRFDGTLDFNRNWADYKNGFGDLNSEFWLGNDKIHQLTSRGSHTFQFVFYYGIERKLSNGTYGRFQVANETDNYRIEVSQFIGGNGGDAFRTHNGLQFSTPDRDNDEYYGKCAQKYQHGFWFEKCFQIQPNGFYRPNQACTVELDFNCVMNVAVGNQPVLGTELKIRWN